MALTDLFFLLVYVLRRDDCKSQWVFERCREVQASPDGHLDLWARGHYKSTIITFALTIQDILSDPEITVGIFSHTRDIAKAFLRQIKREFEENTLLQTVFDDVLWPEPKRQAAKWSENDGIVVKRKSNPKEATVEAWGLVDGQPTGRHFKSLIYDDVVTRDSVITPHQIMQTTAAWRLSLNLVSREHRIRYVGTRYHHQDTYSDMIKASIPVRLHPATSNGLPDGEPVFLTVEELTEKRNQMGLYIYGCQMLQDPTSNTAMGLKPEWRRQWAAEQFDGLNVYILVDPSSGRKTRNGKNPDGDFTALWVVGIGADGNKYVITHVRDRLRLTQRTKLLFAMHRQYQPIAVGYEQYGMQADVEHIKAEMETVNYRFDITELGGQMPKHDRIMRLTPDLEAGRWHFPKNGCHYVNTEGEAEDMLKAFYDQEYDLYPMVAHDDSLDGLSRIYDEDMKAVQPEAQPKETPAWARQRSQANANLSPWAA